MSDCRDYNVILQGESLDSSDSSSDWSQDTWSSSESSSQDSFLISSDDESEN